MVSKFMCEKLAMSDDDVARCGPVQACSTNNDFLIVKFASVQQSRIINSFKKNLPKEAKVDDFVPPCLVPWEQVLLSHGNKLRAERSSANFNVRTRCVWLKGTRVLQAKLSPHHGFQNILGLEGLKFPLQLLL